MRDGLCRRLQDISHALHLEGLRNALFPLLAAQWQMVSRGRKRTVQERPSMVSMHAWLVAVVAALTAARLHLPPLMSAVRRLVGNRRMALASVAHELDVQKSVSRTVTGAK